MDDRMDAAPVPSILEAAVSSPFGSPSIADRRSPGTGGSPLFTVQSSLGPVHPSRFVVRRTLFNGLNPRWLLWFAVAHVVEFALRARNRFSLMASCAHSRSTTNDSQLALGLTPITSDHSPLITAFSSWKVLALGAVAYGVGLALGLVMRAQLG